MPPILGKFYSIIYNYVKGMPAPAGQLHYQQPPNMQIVNDAVCAGGASFGAQPIQQMMPYAGGVQVFLIH